MPEELIEEVNWDGKVVAIRPRSELKKTPFLHKASLIIPQQNGKLLLCKRAKDKHPYPGTWCCAVGGKVAVGESYETAAYREMQEEVGVRVPLSHVADFAYDSPEHKSLFSLFTTTEQFPEKLLKLDPSEIQYLQSFTLKELDTMITRAPNEFAPTFLAALRAYLNAVKA